MKRKQVFVRAVNAKDKWVTVDVLDLDDASFRAFVLGILFRAGLVTGIGDDFVDGKHIELKEEVPK